MRVMVVVFLLAVSITASAKEIMVDQKGKAFSMPSVTIKAHDSIAFRNMDPFVHNIFSLDDAMTFDLGTYPQGQSKSVTFNLPGKFTIECAIHPEMRMIVTVEP